jgi:hypothetical protein
LPCSAYTPIVKRQPLSPEAIAASEHRRQAILDFETKLTVTMQKRNKIEKHVFLLLASPKTYRYFPDRSTTPRSERITSGRVPSRKIHLFQL